MIFRCAFETDHLTVYMETLKRGGIHSEYGSLLPGEKQEPLPWRGKGRVLQWNQEDILMNWTEVNNEEVGGPRMSQVKSVRFLLPP